MRLRHLCFLILLAAAGAWFLATEAVGPDESPRIDPDRGTYGAPALSGQSPHGGRQGPLSTSSPRADDPHVAARDETPRTISARVHAMDRTTGAPVEGALVTTVRADGFGVSGRTGASGTVHLTLAGPVRAIRFRVEADGYAPVETSGGSTGRAIVRLDPRRDLTVKIVDDRGAPVAGAQVSILAGWSGDRDQWGTARTNDADGRCTLALPPGWARPRVSVHVRCEGFMGILAVVDPSADATVLALRERQAGSIVVRDRAGDVRAGVRLALVPQMANDKPMVSLRQEVRTNDDGIARLETLLASEVYRIDDVDRPHLRATPGLVSSADLLSGVVVVFESARPLRVNVRTEGVPLPDVLVHVLEKTRAGRHAATTDADGRATVWVSTEADGALLFSQPGHKPMAQAYSPADEQIDVEMSSVHPARVRVVDRHRQPVPGARVTVTPTSAEGDVRARLPSSVYRSLIVRATTNAEGEAAITVCSGAQRVSARTPLGGRTSLAVEGDDIGNGVMTIQVYDPAQWRVRVVDRDGQAIAGAVVAARVVGLPMSTDSVRVTDDDGAVVLSIPALGQPLREGTVDETTPIRIHVAGAGMLATEVSYEELRARPLLVAERAALSTFKVTLRSRDGAQDAVPYRVAFRHGGAPLATGHLRANVSERIQVRKDMSSVGLLLGGADTAALRFPLDPTCTSMEIELPVRRTVLLETTSPRPIQLMLRGRSNKATWRSPWIERGKPIAVHLFDDPRGYSLTVSEPRTMLRRSVIDPKAVSVVTVEVDGIETQQR